MKFKFNEVGKAVFKATALILILFALLVFFIEYNRWQRNETIDKNPIFTTARIYDVYYTPAGKGGHRYGVKYRYKVYGEFLDGDQTYYPHLEHFILNIGDSCKIAYSRSNPRLSKILTNKDGSLRIIRMLKGYVPLFPDTATAKR